MAAIKGKNTKPELAVRKFLHALGYRFNVFAKLPGKPDIAFPRRKKIVFVHGCYWHMHACKWGRVVEATRTEFWQTKRRGNVTRDERTMKRLEADGWQVFVVWACETKDLEVLRGRLQAFLGPTSVGR